MVDLAMQHILIFPLLYQSVIQISTVSHFLLSWDVMVDNVLWKIEYNKERVAFNFKHFFML